MIVFDIETNGTGLGTPAWERVKKKKGLEDDQIAFWPEFSEVVAIAALDCNPSKGDIFSEYSMVLPDFDNEKDLLIDFFKWLPNGIPTLAGHFIKGFDIPFMAKRAIGNKIKCHSAFWMMGKKPWEIPHLDTAEMLQFGGLHRTSLDSACHLIGHPTPKEQMDGAEVAKAVTEDRWEDIRTYCMADTRATFRLLEHIYTCRP